MGQLTRSHDWTQTPPGPPDTWPLSLRTTLGIVLHSAFPMFLFWGDELICFYNDAYRPSLGNDGKHPAVGKPGKSVWPEIWDFIGPHIEQVMTTGEPVWFEDQLVPIYRNGRMEDVYWTFSYGPAFDDDQIAGVLVICAETTEKVVNARLQQEKSELLQAVLDSSSAGISVVSSVRDEQGAIIDFDYHLVNRVTEQTNNRTDLVGKRYSAMHSEYEQAGIFDDFVSVINTGQAIERERHYTGEGFDNWYETVIVKLDDGAVLSFRDITTMVLARQKIEASETYFRQLTDTVPAIIWETDATGYCTYLNKQWYQTTGQTRAEAEGFGWLSATHPDDEEQAGRLFTEANERQTPFNVRYRLRHSDGRYRWVIDQATPRFSATGDYEGMIGTVVDIHDQKLAEEEVTRFQYMAENACDPFILMRQDGTFAYLNQLALDRWGYTADEARHLRVPDVDPIYTDDVFAAAFAQAKTGKLPPFETLHRRKDGTIYPVEVNMGGLLLNGEPHLFAVARDITERKQAEESLRASEILFRDVTNSAPTGLWLSDTEGALTYVNKMLVEWTGLPYDALLGTGWANAIIDEDRERSADVFLTAVAARAHYDVRFRIRRSDGRSSWCQATGDPYYDEEGRYAGYAGFCMDIDELVQQRQAIEMSEAKLENEVQERTRQLQESVQNLSRSNDNLQQFAYVASHDLQEPLRKIQSFGDLLKTQYADQLGAGVDYLSRMQTAAGRMSVLIKDLLTFSRISTQPDNTALVHLEEVVQTALNDLDLVIGETGAQVSVEPLPTVPGDASQLGQLFQNLLSNALKFRQTGISPVIRVSSQHIATAELPGAVKPTRPAVAYQRIDVSDNGIGFDDKYTDRIFQVFQRLHGKNEFVGTGIGLAICEKVVVNHGGAITATSQPGQGATFSIYLPT